MAAKVYQSEDGYTIRGAEPPALRKEPESVRTVFWGWVVELGLKAKDRDLARGLDKDGRPLRRITQQTRKHRKSAMTPTGKGDPTAPPLEPGRQKSRVRSLLTGRAFADRAEFWWKFDPFTGESFAKVLEHQKEQGRDVFGLSPAALKRVVAQAWEKYERYRKGLPVAMPRTIPIAMARPIQAVGSTDLTYATMGINAPSALGQWSGGMRVEDWVKHFRQGAPAAIPGRPSGPYNVLLQHIWGNQPPPSVKAKAALRPAPKPAPVRPEPTPKGAARDRISEEWRRSLPKEEFEAVQSYAAHAYTPINNYLRTGDPGVPNITPEQLRPIIEGVDRALAKASLERTFEVWRGIRDLAAMGLDPDDLVGATIEDPGFLSTSFERGRGISFLREAPGGALLRIIAPKGSKGAFIAPMAMLEGEQEVLFARGAILRITKVYRGRDYRGPEAVLVIEAELSHGR